MASADRTTGLCLDCGFESEKTEYFGNCNCTHCRGPNIKKGINRAKNFLNSEYL